MIISGSITDKKIDSSLSGLANFENFFLFADDMY